MKTILFTLTLASLAASPIVAQIPTNGLIGEFLFAGSASDGSPNPILGPNYVGDTYLTADRFGNANRAYDLSNQGYIQIPFASKLLVTSGLTISAWVNADSLVGQQAIVSRWANAQSSDAYLLMLSGDKPFVAVGNPTHSANGFTGTTGIAAQTWAHLVLTWDNTGTHKIYVNGSLSDTFQDNNFATINDTSTLAMNFGTQASSFRSFSGKLDDIRLYNRAVSLAEVGQLFNEPNPTQVSISELEAIANLRLMPNPTSHIMTIESAIGIDHLYIYALDGKKLLSQQVQSTQTTIDLSTLPNGMFMMQLQTEKGWISKKIIKE